MRIYSMTATFGKLEHQTLTLEPGLNVIHAPNEWGKSTWCAFLLNMLYGIDTRERTTQGTLADKDRYAPWSGMAMSGRMELNWNGRDITIERSSTPRIPFGQFRAYETATGVDIPELTAANCGQQLLGVEKNVFTRAGFLRFSDLPVTHDDALRRRLNNLVTTGDESGDADMLGQALKDLKNKCRSAKRTGLLPEAEAQRERLVEQLRDLQELEQQSDRIRQRQGALELQLLALENHRCALLYQASLEDAQKVLTAKQAALDAQERAAQLAEAVRQKPARPDAQAGLIQAQSLQDSVNALLADQRLLPAEPIPPAAPAPFRDITPDDALRQAGEDTQAIETLKAQSAAAKKSAWAFGGIGYSLCAILLLAAILLPLKVLFAAAGLCAVPGSIGMILCNGRAKKHLAQCQHIENRYPGIAPAHWLSYAQAYADSQLAYARELEAYRLQTQQYRQNKAALDEKIAQFTAGQTLTERREAFAQALQAWDAYEQAERSAQQAQQHAEALCAMAKTVQPPKDPDTLQHSLPETEQMLSTARFEQKQLQLKLGQCMGQMETLGTTASLQAQLQAVNKRISRLEQYYSAIDLAQDTLFKTTVALQRRFSPRITKRTQQLFSHLTADRYQRVTMADDMSLRAAAQNEDTLQELRRRSDGTVDQLYFALRLAVAEELTPQAPLILDDALVRFDDDRLRAAMDLLEKASQDKQVILFTCQKREEACLNQ